jgi:hypothetical protein
MTGSKGDNVGTDDPTNGGSEQGQKVESDSESITVQPIHSPPQADATNKPAESEKPKSFEKVIAGWTRILGISTIVWR